MDTTRQSISYTFHYADRCNMCGSPVAGHRIVGQRLNHSQGLRPKSKNGVTVSVMKCNVCDLIYAKIIVPLVDKYMAMTNTGMQISIFLQKNSRGEKIGS